MQLLSKLYAIGCDLGSRITGPAGWLRLALQASQPTTATAIHLQALRAAEAALENADRDRARAERRSSETDRCALLPVLCCACSPELCLLVSTRRATPPRPHSTRPTLLPVPQLRRRSRA